MTEHGRDRLLAAGARALSASRRHGFADQPPIRVVLAEAGASSKSVNAWFGSTDAFWDLVATWMADRAVDDVVERLEQLADQVPPSLDDVAHAVEELVADPRMRASLVAVAAARPSPEAFERRAQRLARIMGWSDSQARAALPAIFGLASYGAIHRASVKQALATVIRSTAATAPSDEVDQDGPPEERLRRRLRAVASNLSTGNISIDDLDRVTRQITDDLRALAGAPWPGLAGAAVGAVLGHDDRSALARAADGADVLIRLGPLPGVSVVRLELAGFAPVAVPLVDDDRTV